MKTYSGQSKTEPDIKQPKASKQASACNILHAYKGKMLQRQEIDDDELLQGKFDIIQHEKTDEDELLQRKSESSTTQLEEATELPIENRTGMPDNLKSGIESLSGYSMDDVRVHYNSSKPAQLQALAYAQGTDIHIAPGQEQHLPHEAWHVVQQKQGRVQTTTQLQGVNINDSEGLETEADVMGERARNNSSTKNINKNETLLLDKIIQLYTNGQFEDNDVITYLRNRNYLQALPNNRWLPVTNLGAKKEHAFRELDNRAINNNANNIWNWYPRNNFISDAGDRVEHPEHIDQARTGTCGVVAIQYIQASSQPVSYVDAITDIYFNGQLNGINIQPEQATRPANDNSNLDNIDWLYIVPFRHIKNSILSYRGEAGVEGMLRGLTTPGTVAEWMRTELNATFVQQNYVFSGAWNEVTALQNQINDNHVVVLYVSSDGTLDGTTKTPNHFVVLKNVRIYPGPVGGGSVDLDIYTWGALHTIHLNEAQVRKYVWKIIIGSLP